jgi:HAMP domain-containing protein/HPt (histidine-containing phosphotransfer) domain-containing protein
MVALPKRHTPPVLRSTLRGKFIRTTLFVSAIIGGMTLVIVLLLSARASSRHLAEIEASIEESITSKGKVLTENQALALRGMILDNAFLDMQTLLARAVGEDSDLVYGLFVNSEGESLAFRRWDVTDAAVGAPSKEAWRSVGLARAELIVPKESVQRALRLGQEVVEVAVPVLGEDHEVVGTLRYGLSTRRMHQAIVAAAAESKSQQLRSVLLIGAAVGLATLLGIGLGRVQAVRMTRPVQALTQAATELAEGNRSVRVAIDSGDELEMLGFSFNRMVDELSSSYRELEEMNRTLEQKVEERTLALACRNRDMRVVLDNVDQGFITLSLAGAMASERSAVVEKWFGNGKSETFWQYLSTTSPGFAAEFELAWDQVVADVLPYEVAIGQLPSRLVTPGSTFSIRYLPFLSNERPDGVVVVIADITVDLQREREEEELAELMQVFRRLTLDRSGFVAFIAEASAMVELICRHPAGRDLSVIKITLHTLKGNAGQVGLTVVARLCHRLENELSAADEMSAESLVALSGRWNVIAEQLSQLLGPVERRTIEVSDSDYAALVATLARDAQFHALDQALSWQLEPASQSLDRLAEQARALAQRLGKGDLRVQVHADGVRLDPAVYGPLFSELGHVVRNAVDHGVEHPDERQAQGKSPDGQLVLTAEIRNNLLQLEIADDGRGIDWDSIRERGRALGLPNQTQADLLAILCRQGVTTRSDVTEISGRGVGMSAVNERVAVMHGRLQVRSSPGNGTTWTIVLPWAPDKMIQRLRPRAALAPSVKAV